MFSFLTSVLNLYTTMGGLCFQSVIRVAALQSVFEIGAE